MGATEAGTWDWFLAQPRPLALDEVQKAPRVFSRLKLWIDERRRPGQFVLTGSVRFLSRRAIRESLTGRTALLELLPLTVAEAHGRPLANTVSRLPKLDEPALRQLEADAWCSPATLESYCTRGGMPGICFHRSEGVRRHGRGWYCEDMGLAASACKASWLHEAVPLSRWVFGEFLAQLQIHHANNHEFGEYRTRGGACVPFVITVEDATVLLAVDTAPAPSEKSLKSLGSFRGRGRHIVRVALHAGDEGWQTRRGVWCLPARWLA